MPTARARHMITESDQVAQALELAAIHWPDFQGDRAQLVRLLIAEGAKNLEQQSQARSKEIAVEQASGSMSGVWPPTWRDEMIYQWPE